MSNCLGCEQSANNNERDFETAKSKALEYGKEHKMDMVVYKEFQEWKFIAADYAHQTGLPYRPPVLRYSE